MNDIRGQQEFIDTVSSQEIEGGTKGKQRRRKKSKSYKSYNVYRKKKASGLQTANYIDEVKWNRN